MIHDLSHANVRWKMKSYRRNENQNMSTKNLTNLTKFSTKLYGENYCGDRRNLLMGVWILINVVSSQTNFEYENKSFLWELITQLISFCSGSTLTGGFFLNYYTYIHAHRSCRSIVQWMLNGDWDSPNIQHIHHIISSVFRKFNKRWQKDPYSFIMTEIFMGNQ